MDEGLRRGERGESDAERAARVIERAWGATALGHVEDALATGGRVVFDWDNTVIRGDVGDLAMLAILEHELLPRPGDLTRWGPLTPAARAALEASLGDDEVLPLAHPARRLLADVVWTEALPDGTPAFEPRATRALRGSYWMMAAITSSLPAETRTELALQAFERALATPVGTKVAVGSRGHGVECFARPRAAMVALADLALARGVGVTVVSASEELVVRAVASRVVGEALVPHVLGARCAWSARAFPRVEGWPVMTYDEGKRAALAHLVDGVAPELALTHAGSQSIAAGDADTDHALLEDARALIVLVDRGQPRLAALAAKREAEGRPVVRVPFDLV